jgi:hypothetical protein
MNKINLSLIGRWLDFSVFSSPREAQEIVEENIVQSISHPVDVEKMKHLDSKMTSLHCCQCWCNPSLWQFQEQGHLGRNLSFQLLSLSEKSGQREF